MDDNDKQDWEEETCPECLGLGYIVTCIDDLCAGSDHCIHGDGEEVCEECQGEGFILTTAIERAEGKEEE